MHLGAAGGADAVGEAAQQAALLLGVQQRLERLADDLVGGVAEHPLDRRALVGDRVVGAQDRDEVGGVGHERGEPRLRGLAVHLLRQLGAAERQRHLVGERAHRVAGVGIADRQAGDDEHEQRVSALALAQLEPEDRVLADGQAQLLAGVSGQHRDAARIALLHERGDLARDGPVDQPAALVDGEHADALAGDPAQARVDLISAELDDGLERGDHDLVAIGGADKQAARGRERLLARGRLLALAHETGHASHHQAEQQDRRADEDDGVPVVVRERPDELEHRCDERGAGEQDEPESGEARLAAGLHIGELHHRRVQRRGAPQEVEEDPAGVQPQLVGVGAVQA